MQWLCSRALMPSSLFVFGMENAALLLWTDRSHTSDSGAVIRHTLIGSHPHIVAGHQAQP